MHKIYGILDEDKYHGEKQSKGEIQVIWGGNNYFKCLGQ